MRIIKPMGIESPSRFLVDMNSSMDLYQALRETVQNAIQARPLDGSSHKVMVTYNREVFRETGVKKLCVVDTGRGMDSASQERNFSMLCASGGSDWSGDEKKGLGIKGILPSNQAGIVCDTFQGGVGNRVAIGMDPETREAGLVDLYDAEEDEHRQYLHFEDAGLLQEYFPKATHGTIVTLMGNSEEEHTYLDQTIREVAKYLNLRFYTLPEGVEVKADEVYVEKETGKERIQPRVIRGLEYYLLADALASDSIALDDGGNAHLFHIDKKAYGKHHDTCRNLTTGFKHDTEFYPLTPYAADEEKDKARKILPYRQCGFNYGEAPSEIAIIIEPPQARIEGFKRTYGAYPTQARNTLLFSDGKDAPNLVPDWGKYGAEIQTKMPKYFQDLKRKREEELSLKVDADDEELRRQSAAETLKDAEMYAVKKGGGLKVLADLPGGFPGGGAAGGNITGKTTPPPKKGKHGGGNGGTMFTTGAPGETSASKKPLTVKLLKFLPSIVVSTDLEWAASIHNMVCQLDEGTNTLKVNAEFPPLVPVVERLVTEWEGVAPPDFVRQIVASERNTTISDAIVKARILRRDPVMSACVNTDGGLMSPSALTTPFLGSSNTKAFEQRVNRRVAAKFGAKKARGGADVTA